MDALWQDLRYAARTMARTPGFTTVVALILALGIGATTAVFNLVNGLVLKSLPVAEPSELVWFRNPAFSYPIFAEVQARATVFSGLFAWDIQDLNVEWSADVQPTQTLLVTGGFYSTLRVGAVRGRTLTPQDDRPGSPLVAVISNACWRARFGEDPAVVGKTLRIEGQPFEVVGVTPPEFFGVAVGMRPEITIPVATVPLLRPQDAGILQEPHGAWLHLMARLKPGVTLKQADGTAQAFWPQVMEATTPANMPSERRLKYLSRTTGLVAGRSGFSRVRRQFSEPLWLLLALVGLLLLVACATVANLLLARTSARRGEMAVRLALGAGRGRLVRQLLTEAVVLAAVGGAVGLLLASWGSEALVRLLSTRRDPIVLDLAPDWRVLAFVFSATVVTALVFAVAPALRASRVDPGPTLKDTARLLGHDRRRYWLGKALVVSQVALSMLLVAGAGLFTRSLAHLLSLDPGFRHENVLIVMTDPLFAGYRNARLAAFYDELLERLRSVPGVESASLSRVPPVSNEMGYWTQSIAVDGAPPLPEDATRTYFNAVSPGYFDTLGTPLLRGRDFGGLDTATSPRTVIVNESLARAFFPGQDPIARRISVGRDFSRQDLEIVGIVKDAKYQSLQEPNRRIAYLPHRQLKELREGENLVAEVRTPIPVAAVTEALRREIRDLDGGVPVQLETLSDRIRESLVKERVVAVIASFLGAVALLLASVGLYGLMAYTASRRTNEIGIRVALGAARQQVLWMVLRESLTLAAAGVLLGVAGALAFGRVVAGLLHGVGGSDPVALAAAASLMVAVATLAGFLPARRASRVDPVVALRRE